MQIVRESSQDIEAIAGAMGTLFPGIRFGSAATVETAFRMDGFTGGDDLIYLDYTFRGREVQAEVERADALVFCDLIDYDGAIHAGRTEMDKSQTLVLPGHTVARWENGGAHSLGVREAAVHRVLRGHQVADPESLRLMGTTPIDAAAAAAWQATKVFAQQTLRRGFADDAMIAATLTELVVTALLRTFPNEAGAFTEPRRVASSAAVRRATEFVDEHAGGPITATDIAAVARLSVRGLQIAFQRQLGLTPRTYLRNVRLARARAALLRADRADGAQVAAIARAAGFTHMSRFSAEYFAAFGEYPRETLQSDQR